jgi:hypothetical protein
VQNPFVEPFLEEVCAVEDRQLPTEHHGREYAIGAIGAVAEYLALRYGMNWLAWLAAFLLWLAVVEYTRGWSSARKRWVYAIWIGLFVATGTATYFLIRLRPAPEVAKAVDSPVAAPIQEMTPDNPPKAQRPKARKPNISSSQSVTGENGAAIGSLTQGAGSIAQIGGSNNTATITTVPTIQSVLMGMVFLCKLRDGAKAPEQHVAFNVVSEASVGLKGLQLPPLRLVFVGDWQAIPKDGRIAVIQQYYLPPESQQLGQPVSILANLNEADIKAKWDGGNWCSEYEGYFSMKVNGEFVWKHHLEDQAVPERDDSHAGYMTVPPIHMQISDEIRSVFKLPN